MWSVSRSTAVSSLSATRDDSPLNVKHDSSRYRDEGIGMASNPSRRRVVVVDASVLIERNRVIGTSRRRRDIDLCMSTNVRRRYGDSP